MWNKVLFWFVAVVAAVTVGAYGFLSLNGRRLLNEQASVLTRRTVTVGGIHPIFPNGIELVDLAVDGLLTAKRLRLHCDLAVLLRGEIRIVAADLDRPVLFVNYGGDTIVPLPVAAASGSVASLAAQNNRRSQSVSLTKLVIHRGSIRIQDVKSNRRWNVKDVEGEARNIPLAGEAARTQIALTASLAGLDLPFVGRTLKASGWLNWALKDMDVTVLSVDDSGRSGLEARLLSQANDLEVKGRVRLTGQQVKQSSGERAGMLENAVLGVLLATSGDIDAGFSFHTAMDHFQMSRVALSGTMTTDLNSGGSSATIVDSLKAVGEQLLTDNQAPSGVKL